MGEVIDPYKNLPRRIKIGAYTFRIFVVDTDHPKLEENAGMTYLNDFVIYLDKNLERQRVAEVVFHEVSHSINWVYGIDDSSTEEQFTTQNSKGFTDVFLNNPKLQTWHYQAIRRMRKESKDD